MAKKEGSVDLRIKRTQRAIKESFFKLVDEKGFEHISVKDITDGAMISRNTFYLHYADKYDLLNKICDELLASLFIKVRQQLEKVQHEKYSIESIASVVEHGVACIDADKNAYKILFTSSSADVLTNKLDQALSISISLFSNDIGDIDDFSIQYIVNGMIGIIKYYAINDIEDIHEKCVELSKINFGKIIEFANNKRQTIRYE